MPELPEVETIRRDLTSRILNKTLNEISVLHKNFLTKSKISLTELLTLKGKKLLSLERKGKYLFLNFEEKTLIFHLGLTGALILDLHPIPENLKKHHLLTMTFEQNTLHYIDIRKFGKIYLIDSLKISFFLNRIGPDALQIEFEKFRELLQKHNLKIKTLLLNQRLISGLGNIYTDEVLFRAKINPERLSNTLSEEEVKSLYEIMKSLLKEAILLRGSSVKNYVDGEGKRGKFQERHLVYGKKGRPCPECGTPLQYKKINQRGTVFCPNCQK
ncbi:MAG: DNA-formamidopyrimidine glycosylase [Caldimicrobium sp.]|jgi:formamidopyrimidine-DNA glycosylase